MEQIFESSPWAPMLPFVLATAIIAAASALQAVSGMGMALLAAPLLVLIDPAFVPGPMLCAVMALSAAVARRDRAAIDRSVLTMALWGLLAGTVIGAALLAAFAGMNLVRVLAMLILGAVLLSIFAAPVRVGGLSLLIGGAASGVLGTMSGVHGPPIALVLQHEPPERLRVTLCAFFAVGSALSILALAITGVFGIAQVGASLELLPGVAVGLAVAPLISRRIDRRRARAAVLAISAISALVLLLR
jgi:uncharacterized membrane protein YfcA